MGETNNLPGVTSRGKTSMTDLPQSLLSEVHGSPLPNPLPTLKQLFTDTAKKWSRNVALICMHQLPSILPIDIPQQVNLEAGKRFFQTGDPLSSNLEGNTNGTVSGTKYLRWTHGQLQYAAEALVLRLKARGVGKGQPIAALIFNGVEWAILVRAAAIMGCPFVPLNPRGVGNAREIEHMLKLLKAKVLFAANVEIASKLESALPELLQTMTLRVVLEGDRSPGLLAWSKFSSLFITTTEQNEEQPDGLAHDASDGNVQQDESDDIALIIFTSGTTSLPKGGIYTSTTITASAISAGIALNLNDSSRTCCHLPNHHLGGIQMILAFMAVGGSVVFPSAGFDPAASLHALSKEKCTNFPCVPAILQAFAAQPNYSTTDTSSLINVETGATTILPEHMRQVWSILRCKSVSNAYAATECGPVTLGFFDSTRTNTVNVGSACAGVKIRICAPESRVPIPRGEAGELHVTGSQAIKGYLRGTSAGSFYDDSDGRWFITGDQGIMADDGTITISGRYKDLIIRGGENIAPAAIETILDTKLGITAQVVGLKNEVAGEVPVAIIQPKEGQNIVPTEIRTAISKHLGPAFVPEKFYTLEELNLKDYPRTSSGKVRKVEIKALLEKHEEMLEEEVPLNNALDSVALEDRLMQLWHKTIGIDINALHPNSSIKDLADSLTLMRLRNFIKRDTGLDVSTAELLEAGTIAKQASLLSGRWKTPVASSLPLIIQRKGPPGMNNIAIALGSCELTAQVQKQVTEAISPYGFNWEDDVEDILPDWDFGSDVFGSVAGSGKINLRMSLSTTTASVDELQSAICAAVKHHAMQRSFELPGVNGDSTMRVIMRPNEKWWDYSISQIPEVEHPDDLTRLLYDEIHFANIQEPYPSFHVKIAHIKSTNTASMILALQHSAFDGLSLASFLEDLDSILLDPAANIKPHIPYKLWTDMYYLHRSSLASKRSVAYQLRRLNTLKSHTNSLFPRVPADFLLADFTQRKTFIQPLFLTPLPHLTSLRQKYSISPFILAKAALAIFLGWKTKTDVAVFSQHDNGRSWPFMEEWQQSLLPDCMDVDGPTLQHTVQVIPISPEVKIASYLTWLKEEQEDQKPHVHAPWNLVRRGLGDTKTIFDMAAFGTCLNYLPIRTKNGKIMFQSMKYHETKVNGEMAWILNCGVEGEESQTQMWSQAASDEGTVANEDAILWARQVMRIVQWLCDQANWDKAVRDCIPNLGFEDQHA